MNKLLLAFVVITAMAVVLSSAAYASPIVENIITPTSWEYPYMQNQNIKLETHFDMWNNDNDAEPCEDLFCMNQAYDYVLDPDTNEVIGKWSMFKLQRKTGNNWKNLNIIEHRYEDCSSEGTACMKRVMKMNQNTYMNVTYELKESDNKIKFTIDINSGLSKEYRLKYRLLSNEQINYNLDNKNASFGDYFYDWNDITGLTTESIVSADGLTLDQITYIGELDKDETITIDPLISAAYTVDILDGNIIEVYGNNTYVFLKDTSVDKIMAYKSSDNGDTWSNTANLTDTQLGTEYGLSTYMIDDLVYVIYANDSSYIKVDYYNVTSDAWTNTKIAFNRAYTSSSKDNLNPSNIIKVDINATTEALCWVAYQYYSTDQYAFPSCLYKLKTNYTIDSMNPELAIASGQRKYSVPGIGNEFAAFENGGIDYGLFCVNGNSGYCKYSQITNLSNWTSTTNGVFSIKLISMSDGNIKTFYGANFSQATFFANNFTWSTAAVSKIALDPVRNGVIIDSDGYCMAFFEDGGFVRSKDADCNFYDYGYANISSYETPSLPSYADRLFIYQNGDERFGRFVYTYIGSVNSGSSYYNSFPDNLGIYVTTIDEETDAQITAFDITVSNDTVSDTDTAVDVYYGEAGGETTVRVSKTGYSYRFYYINLTASNTPYYLNAYLLNSSSGNYVRFHIYDQNTNTIEGASVVAYKFIDGVYTQVEIGTTDGSGTATLFLDPVVSYRIATTSTGCTGLNTTITPTSEDYAIQLTCTSNASLANYTAEYTGFTYLIYPSATGLCNSTTQAFYVYLNDTESLLGSYSVNLTNSTGASLWYDSGVLAGGENMTTIEDLGVYHGGEALTLTLIVDRSTFSEEKTFLHKYYVWDWNCADDGAYNTSLMSIVNKVNAGTWEIDNLTLLLIALFISICAAGLTFAVANVGGGGASIIFLATFGTLNMLFNFMDWGIFGLIVMGALAVVLIR